MFLAVVDISIVPVTSCRRFCFLRLWSFLFIKTKFSFATSCKDKAKIVCFRYCSMHACWIPEQKDILYKRLLWLFPRVFLAPRCEDTWVGKLVVLLFLSAYQKAGFEFDSCGLSGACIWKIFGLDVFPSVMGKELITESRGEWSEKR